MALGIHETSFLSELLPQGLDATETYAAKWSAMSLYAAGADTVCKTDAKKYLESSPY